VEPIALHCGHAICKSCLPETSSSSICIECKVCGDNSSINLNKLVEFQYINQLIKANYSVLFESAIFNSNKSFQILSGILNEKRFLKLYLSYLRNRSRYKKKS